MNIYVGNLSLSVTKAELCQEFAAFGQVNSINIMDDRYIGSGQPRCYAFVEMSSRLEGQAAILGLNGKKLGYRALDVIEALPLSGNKDAVSDHSGRRNSNRKTRQRN